MNWGICFSGGGIKGVAHIGALKAFEEENIHFNYIAGTSFGSIIATLYALGYRSDEMYEIIKENINKIGYVDWKNILLFFYGIIFKRKLIIQGLNSGEKIEKLVNKICEKKGIKNINQIKEKLLIPSVNLTNGKIYIFSSIKNRATYSDKLIYIQDMEIGKAVRASCSFPGVFSPVKYRNTYLVDGGIRENIPWKELKNNGAEKVISIIFQNEIEEKNKINLIDVIGNSIDILCHELENYEIEGADYLIKINTKNISLLDKTKIDYLYQLGYIETKKRIKEINIL